MTRRHATVLVLLLAVLTAVAVAGLTPGPRATPASLRTVSNTLLDQTRADTLAGVAQRIYYQEVFGSPNSAAFNLISTMPALVSALETGNLALARDTLNRVILRHVVHERVVRGRRTLVDVGLPFVVAGQRHALRAPDGTYLGRIEISIQDVIGFVKLFHRLTGADIVVRGSAGHAKSAPAAFRNLALPASGPVTVAGRTYFVSSFGRLGFGGEPLQVLILVPAG